MKILRKIFAIALLALCWQLASGNRLLFAQTIDGPGATRIQQTAGYPWQFAGDYFFTSASGPSTGFDVRGINYYRITWIPQAGFSGTCAISLDGATNLVPGTGALSSPVIGGILSAATIGSCATKGQYLTNSIAGIAAYGQITPTIVGTGTVIVIIFGYTDNPAAGGVASSIISSPLDGAGNVKTNCEVGCSAGTPGQATMAASQPVVIASNQSTLAVSGTLNANMQTWNGSAWINAVGWPGDGSAFTPGTSPVAPMGAYYATSIPNCVTGETCTPMLTVDRKLGAVTQPLGFGSTVGFQQAVTASAVALASNAAHAFCIQALSTNALTVYIGASGETTSTGYPLLPGQFICPQLTNTNLVYVIASGTGSSVAIFGF